MNNRHFRKFFAAAFTTVLLATQGFSQANPASGKKLAVVNGETISDDQVKKAATEDIENLELKKMQAEAEFQRDQHDVYQRTLTNIIDNKLLDVEAKKRGISVEDLLRAEVEKKVTPPTDKDVKDFYEANRARIPSASDEIMGQIRTYLSQRYRDDAYSAFTSKLRQDYKVENYLEPLRTSVATQGFPSMGPATAAVTIVEFSDFECPYCGALFPVMKKIEADFGDRIRVVYRQMPLTNIHPHAQKAAEASLCAFEQQKFWELHDAMFQDNKNLDVNALKQKASVLKLDSERFNTCLDSAKYAAAVTKDAHEGVKLGVAGTPAMFINGRFFGGVLPYEEIAKVINEELQNAKK
jgi:protein-disulfide isomerase